MENKNTPFMATHFKAISIKNLWSPFYPRKLQDFYFFKKNFFSCLEATKNILYYKSKMSTIPRNCRPIFVSLVNHYQKKKKIELRSSTKENKNKLYLPHEDFNFHGKSISYTKIIQKKKILKLEKMNMYKITNHNATTFGSKSKLFKKKKKQNTKEMTPHTHIYVAYCVRKYGSNVPEQEMEVELNQVLRKGRINAIGALGAEKSEKSPSSLLKKKKISKTKKKKTKPCFFTLYLSNPKGILGINVFGFVL